jgi:hypothetical protein
MKFMKHLKKGASYTSLGTSAIIESERNFKAVGSLYMQFNLASTPLVMYNLSGHIPSITDKM